MAKPLWIATLVLLLALTLFYPLVDQTVLTSWWRRGPTEQGTTFRLDSWDAVDLETSAADPVLETDPDFHDHDITDDPYLWNHSCDRHLGSTVPVKPPRVPWWVVRYTLLAHWIADYSDQCTNG